MESMGPANKQDGTWVYPPIGAALETVGMDDIEVYIAWLQNTITQYIATRPIMELCLAAERKPGLQLSMQWWEHPALDILGIRAGNAAADVGGGETGTEKSEGEGEGD